MTYPLNLRILGVLAFAVLPLIAPAANAAPFRLSSLDVKDGEELTSAQVFNGFGCKGENRSPALQWSAPPAGTKSLAVTMYDPDAPTGSGWWHWLVVNLPAETSRLPANAGVEDSKTLPGAALQTRTDYGQTAFGGACPPVGDKPHRYVVTLWALDVESLPVKAEMSGAMVGYYLHQHAIGTATLTPTYQRTQ